MTDTTGSDSGLLPLGVAFGGAIDPSFPAAQKAVLKAIQEIESAQGKLNTRTQESIKPLKGYQDILVQVQKRGEIFASAVDSIVDKFGKHSVETQGIVKELVRLDDEYKKLSIAGKNTNQVLGAQFTAFNAAGEAVRRYMESAKGLTDAHQRLSDANRKLGTGLADAKFETTALGTAITKAADRSDVYHKALTETARKLGINNHRTTEYARSLSAVDSHLRKVAEGGGKGAVKAVSTLSDATRLGRVSFDHYLGKIKLTETGYQKIEAASRSFGQSLKTQTGRMAEVTRQQTAIRKAAHELYLEYGRLGATQKDYQRILEKKVAAHGDVQRAVKRTRHELRETIRNLKEAQAAEQDRIRSLQASKKAADEKAKADQDLARYARALNEQYSRFGVTFQDAQRLLREQAAAGKTAAEAYEKLGRELARVRQEQDEERLAALAGVKGTTAQIAEVKRLQKEKAKLKRLASELAKEFKGLNVTQDVFLDTLKRATRRIGNSAAAYKAVQKQLRMVEKQARATASQVSLLDRGMARLGASLKTVATYGIAATLLFQVEQGAEAAFEAIIEYSQALANLQAISTATDAEIKAMGSTILMVAEKTKFSATEISDGLVFLVQAGLSAAEAIATIEATADIAAGTLSSLEDTADLMTTTLRAFNIEASDSTRISDVMATSINKSKLNVEKLRVIFNYAGAGAKQAGVEFEEVAVAAQVLANNGMRMSTIGTGLRQVIAKLLAPNKELRESFRGLGLDISKLNPQTHTLGEVLQNLSHVLYDNKTKTVDMAKAYELFKLRGAQTAAVLVKEFTSGNFNEAIDNVYAVGTAAEMSATQQKGLGFQLKNLSDVARVAAVALGDAGLADAIGLLIGAMKGLTVGISSLLETGFGELLVKIPMTTAATAALILSVRGLFSLLASATAKKAMGGLVKFLTALPGLYTATAATAGAAAGAQAVFASVVQATGGPILWTAAAIGTLLAVLWKYHDANRKAAEAAAVAAVETGKLAESAGGFTKSLKEAEGNAKLYNATVERLKQAHPDLADGLLETAAGMEDVGAAADIAYLESSELLKVLRQFRKEQLSATWQKNQEAVRAYAEETRRSRIALETLNTVESQYTGTAADLFVANQNVTASLKAQQGALDSLSKTEKNLRAQVNAAIQIGLERVKAGDMTREQLELTIQTLGLTREETERAMDAIHRAFLKAAQGTSKLSGSAEKESAKLRGEWKTLYDDLDSLRRVDLLKAKTALDANLAQIQKYGELRSLKEEEISDMIAAEQARALQDFMQMLREKQAAGDEDFKATKARLKGEMDAIRNAAQGELAVYRKLLSQKLKEEQDFLVQKIALEKQHLQSMETSGNATRQQIRDQHEKIRKLEEQLQKTISLIRKRGAKDFDVVLKEETANRKVELDRQLAEIERQEAAGTLTHEKATQKKAEIERDFAQLRVDLMDAYAKSIAETLGKETKEFRDAMRNRAHAAAELQKAQNRVTEATEGGNEALEKKGQKLKEDKEVTEEHNKTQEEAAEKAKILADAIQNMNSPVSIIIKDTIRWRNELTNVNKVTFGELSQAMDRIYDKAQDFQQPGMDWAFFAPLVHYIGEARHEVRDLERDFEKLDNTTRNYGIRMDMTNLTLGEAVALAADLSVTFGEFHRKLGDLDGKMAGLAAETEAWLHAVETGYRGAGQEAEDFATRTRAAMDKAVGGFRDVSGQVEELQEKAKALHETEWVDVADMQAASDDVVSMYEEILEAGTETIEELKALWHDLADDIREIDDEIISIQKDTAEKQRDLLRKTMTEQEAWNDTRLEFEETYSQAVTALRNGEYDLAVQLFNEARNVASELSAEVKNESGEVVASLEENTRSAIRLMEQAAKGATDALKQQRQGIEGQQDAIQNVVGKTKKELSALEWIIDEINRKFTVLQPRDGWHKFYSKTLGYNYASGDPIPNPVGDRYAKRKKFGRGGVVGGNLHSHGGTNINAEKDEVVINRKDAMKHLDFLLMLNNGQISSSVTASIARAVRSGIPMAEKGRRMLKNTIQNIRMPDVHIPVPKLPEMATAFSAPKPQMGLEMDGPVKVIEIRMPGVGSARGTFELEQADQFDRIMSALERFK